MTQNFEILSAEDVQNHLKSLSGWEVKNNGLSRYFEFKNFIEAFAFISKVAITVEKLNHHPEIFNSYNRVTISGLCTHDANNAITTLDIELARQISKL